MPIALRFHIVQMEELATQMKRAPLHVRSQQLDVAEALICEIDGDMLYPLDYVIFRITKYRVETPTPPMLLGSALVSDLVALVAVVSKAMSLPASKMLTMTEVASELEVSQRTVNRLKHEGLAFRWVTELNGRVRLGCSIETLHLFRTKQKGRINKASSFSRLSNAEQDSVVQMASKYQGRGRTLNDVAKEIANTTGRGHETIRLLLREDDLLSNALVQKDILTRSDAKVIERALQRGVSWKDLQIKYSKTTNAMRGAVARLQASRLKQFAIPSIELEVFNRKDAKEVILSPSIVRSCLPPVLSLDLFQMDISRFELTVADETSIVSAMHLLRMDSRKCIKGFSYTPSEQTIDLVETNLRWSFLLQQRLMLFAFPSALNVATQHVGRPLYELPEIQLASILKIVISTIGEVCGSLDPIANQTAVKTTSAVLDRRLSSLPDLKISKRAAAKYVPQGFLCPFHGVVSWGRLIPTQDLPERAIQANNVDQARAVALKYGWEGFPRTNDEIENELGKSHIWVRRVVQSCH